MVALMLTLRLHFCAGRDHASLGPLCEAGVFVIKALL